VPRLLVIKGTDEGKQFELTAEQATIGRDVKNVLRLHDTEVSRRHAEFLTAGDTYLVRDLGSANGTFVNNKKVKEATLQAGDRIQIGQTVMVYSTGRSDAGTYQPDLADQINMISRHDLEISSAIVKAVDASEGSQILAHPDKATSQWLKEALANLSAMYDASQAVSHILDLNQLLDTMLDLIFGRIIAERGCILLTSPESGELEPCAVRWRNEAEQQQKMNLSRTIVEYVMQKKQGVLVTDAAQDDRFNTGQSIVRLGIREVICVPMKGRHETLGVLYLDTRINPRELADRKTAVGRLTEDHLHLAIAIAHQAALAVEESRYHQAMVQAERLAAIGQTIAQLSHGIKNILQGLKTGTDMLRMGMQGKDENLLEQGWKIIDKNQSKIEDIVIDMLSYSKDREPAIEDSDLNDIVRDVYELMARRAEELGITLRIDLVDHLPMAQVDPEGIHRALLNVVTNALDAVEGRENAKVIIATRRDRDPAWLLILVADNGSGIPPDKLRDIFKPFVSTKGAKGTGLGLAVSQKTLREHGGDILVESHVGKSTKFTLRIPIRSALALDMTGTGHEIFPPQS
jgi:signal transduction histidine kinase/pSer/pThr/pTyr-binding forkhead associated (FHA) protein